MQASQTTAPILDDTHPSPGGRQKPRSKKTQRRAGSLAERLKPALVLQNSGSVARDHLASERTFLAYVRTSLAIASTGVGETP